MASYSTNFPNAEFSNGLWTLGLEDGIDWTDPTTSLSTAYGTQNPFSGHTDDSIALLKQSFAPSQYASAIVFNDGTLSGNTFEVELILRGAISAHSFQAYECNLAFDGAYAQIVRLNGPLDQFTYIDAGGTFSPAPATGDLFEVQIVGNIITTWLTPVLTHVRKQLNTGDITAIGGAVYANGHPGVGFWHGDNQRHYGFNSFTVDDHTGISLSVSGKSIVIL